MMIVCSKLWVIMIVLMNIGVRTVHVRLRQESHSCLVLKVLILVGICELRQCEIMRKRLMWVVVEVSSSSRCGVMNVDWLRWCKVVLFKFWLLLWLRRLSFKCWCWFSFFLFFLWLLVPHSQLVIVRILVVNIVVMFSLMGWMRWFMRMHDGVVNWYWFMMSRNFMVDMLSMVYRYVMMINNFMVDWSIMMLWDLMVSESFVMDWCSVMNWKTMDIMMNRLIMVNWDCMVHRGFVMDRNIMMDWLMMIQRFVMRR